MNMYVYLCVNILMCKFLNMFKGINMCKCINVYMYECVSVLICVFV